MAVSFLCRKSFNDLAILVMNAHGEVAISLAAAITATLELSASLQINPPTLHLLIEALVEFDAQLSLGLSLGLPTVSFGFSAVIEAIAKLNLSFELLIQLQLLLDLGLTSLWGMGINGVGNTLGAQIISFAAAQWPDGSPSSIPASGLIFGASSIPVLPAAFGGAGLAQKKLKQFLNGVPFDDENVSAHGAAFKNLGDLTKVTANAAVQGKAGIQYQLDLCLTASAHLDIKPPTFSATLKAMAKFQAYLLANADLALPSVKFSANAAAALTASLTGKFNLMLELGLALNAPIASMYVYEFNSTAALLGAAMTLELGPTHGNTWGAHGTFDLPSFLPCRTAVVGSIVPTDNAALRALFTGAQ